MPCNIFVAKVYGLLPTTITSLTYAAVVAHRTWPTPSQ